MQNDDHVALGATPPAVAAGTVLPAAAVRPAAWRSRRALAAAAVLLLAAVAGGGYLVGADREEVVDLSSAARQAAVDDASGAAAAAASAAELTAAQEALAAAEAAAAQASADEAAAEAAAAEAVAERDAAEEAAEQEAAQPSREQPADEPAAPPSAPRTPAVSEPADDLGGYTTADYEERLLDIPDWIGKTRDSMARGYTMSVGTELSALGNRFDEVGRLPAPPGIDDAYWYAATGTLADFSRQAAAEWRAGATTEASARFEVIVDESNELIDRANDALGLDVPRS